MYSPDIHKSSQYSPDIHKSSQYSAVMQYDIELK